MTHHDGSGSSTGAMIAAGGGVLAVIGAFLPWFKSTVSYSTELFGGAIPDQSEAFSGMKDWTGIVALLAGLVVAGAAGAIIAMKGQGSAGMMATLAAVGGIVVILAAILGFVRIKNTAGAAVDQLGALGGGVDISTGAGLGLYLSAIGGLLGAIGGFKAKGEVGGAAPAMMPPAPPAA